MAMAMSMVKLVCFLLLALLGISMVATQVMAKEEARYHLDSGQHGPRSKSYQCPRRCSQTQYHKPCILLPKMLCQVALCSSSWLLRQRSLCPCYNNRKTQRGGSKCP